MPRPARHLTDSETASAVSKPWAPLSTRGALANRRNDQNSALAAAFFRRGQRLAQLENRRNEVLVEIAREGVWPRPSNSALDFGWPELALHWQACCYLKQSFRLFILESLVSEDGDAAGVVRHSRFGAAPPGPRRRDASMTTVSATLLPRRRIRDNAPRTIAEKTATDERGVNPSLAPPRRPNVVRCPDAPRSAVYFLSNSARASVASTPPVISTVSNGAACATALLVIMIWPIRVSSCAIDAA